MSYRAEIVEMLRKMPSGWQRQYRVGKETLARNGGPVLPNAPTPEQAMLILGNSAGRNFDPETPRGDQPVPKAVRDAAMKGLRLSYRNNYGGWEFFGIARAIQLALVPQISLRGRERMVRYLNDHERDKAGTDFGNDAKPSRGYMAWLNWGGDPAKAWNERDGIKRATYGASARRTNGAAAAAVKLGAKVGIKGGGKFIPVVGEALMAYDVTQEGRKLYRERKGGKKHSLRETGARLAGSAFVGSEGVAWAQKKLEARKAKKNPALGDTGRLAAVVLHSRSRRPLVLIYDLDDVEDDPGAALVGYAFLSVFGDDEAETTQTAAQSGYGPMLYELAATVLGLTLHPSEEQSTRAKGFWSKQVGGVVRPLTAAAFAAKYGVFPATLLARHRASASAVGWMLREGESTAVGAAQTEASFERNEVVRDAVLRSRKAGAFGGVERGSGAAAAAALLARRKAKKNPALGDTGSLAIHVRYDDFENAYRLVLYDTKKLPARDSALVGYALVSVEANASRAVQTHARKGYGLMLYSVAASYFDTVIAPSEHLSAEAVGFWSRQPGQKVYPLTEAELIAKFGVSLAELKRRDTASKVQFLGMYRLGEDIALSAGSVPQRNPGSTSAVRTDPELWEAVKAEVTRGDRGGLPGQWSARKAQMSVALYKDRGGGYVGPKSPRNALAKWTREQWRTKSGRPSLETGERYLPSAAIEALTDEEYAATTRAKRAGMRKGEQFVPQPGRIAAKVKRYRRNPWEIE